MALYNLAFYRIYHLIFGKKKEILFLFSYKKVERKRSYFKLRILTRYGTWLLDYNYLWMTKWQPCLNKQICLPSMHLFNIKRYEQKYTMNFNKLLS